MGLPHALLLPFPAQGHVIPLMELSHCLVDHGFRITFVNTEPVHQCILAALSQEEREMEHVELVSVPDGLGQDEDRGDFLRMMSSIVQSMPASLEKLIMEKNKHGEEKITCMIVDGGMQFALEVAKKMGLRKAVFWPAAAMPAVTVLNVPELMKDGVIDADGVPMRQEFQLGPGLPLMKAEHLLWNANGDGSEFKKQLFHLLFAGNQMREIAEFILCNSFQELEAPILSYAPNIRPVGPLLTGLRLRKPVGHFLPEDTTCMEWLDQQPASSVLYAAFGSHATFEGRQFRELVLGLELSGRPFLLVARPGFADESTLNAFRDYQVDERRGRIVTWAPQQKVLGHPSIACFISHCGWNSTMEGLRNGVPFLCWAQFADQFINQSYICDIWSTGMNMEPDENKFVAKEQIKSKVEELLWNKEIKARALKLKEKALKSVEEGETSSQNLKNFADALKG